MMNPLVSVVIPVHNGELFVEEALRSVLVQGEPSLEIFLVNDGSTDGTGDLLERLAAAHPGQVRVLHQVRRGAGGGRNAALHRVSGRYLAFLDADDLWIPGKLSCQLKALSGSPRNMCFTQVSEFADPGLSEDDRSKVQLQESPINGIMPSAMLIARADFDRVGEFSEELMAGEFLDWYARAIDAGLEPLIVPELLCLRRVHSTNQGRKHKEVYSREYLKLLRSALKRRKSA